MANSSENVEVKVVFKANTKDLDNAKKVLDGLGRPNSNNGASNTADSLNDAGDAADKLSDKFKNAGNAADALSGSLKNTESAATELSGQLLNAADATDTLQKAFVDTGAAVDGLQDGMQATAAATGGMVDTINNARESAEGFNGSFVDLTSALGEIQGFGNTLKGISGGLLAMGGDAITVAGEFEQMHAKLVTIQKSGQKASETFENAKKLAASTPFDVKGVVNAAVQLEVYGQNSKELLPVVANLASAMGGDVSQAATAMGRALSGSSEGLQSLRDVFGVTTDKLVKFGAALNKQGGIAVDSKENLDKLKKALTGLINTEFGGGIERQAATVAGAMANVEDSVTNLKATIGSQFAPYMVVISRNLADIIEKTEQFAPTIAIFGAVGAAATGMAGTFISAAVAAVGLQAATSKLGLSLGGLVTKMRGVQVAGVSMFAAGGWALGITALIAGAEALNVHLLAQIENEKKLQEGIAEEAKQTVQLRHEWDNLRKAVEEATGAKVKFNEKDLTPGAVGIKEALGSTDVPGLQLYDKLSKSGYTPETIDAKIAQNKEAIKNQKKQIEDALKQYNAYTDAVEVYTQRGYTQPGTEALKSLGITEEELEASKRDVEVRKRRIEQLKEQASDLQAVKDRMSEIADPINKNIKEAQALGEYLKFADATKDIDVLKNALTDVGATLQNLRTTAASQTVVDVSDNKAIAKRMQELLKQNGQDTAEFKTLETIFQMANLYEERQKKIVELQQQDLQKQLEAMDQAYAEQQAGRDRDLEAEREHVVAKLKLAEEERQKRLNEVEKEIRSGKLTQDQLKTEKEYREKLSHATKTEIECKNRLHEIDKKIAEDANKKAAESALQSLDSQIGTLKASADELASSATASSSDIIRAYDIVLQKADEWKKANDDIISQNSKVKSAAESIIKGATSGRKMAVSRQNSELLTSLSEKASDRMVGVSGPLRQLDAVQANLSMYQQALAKLNRDTNNLKETESTRVQLQKTINNLKRQELSTTEQIRRVEEQLASETKSIEIQLEQEKLAALEDRAAAGEQVQQQIVDQQQKIYELELQQLHDAEQKKLKEVEGSEMGRLEVLKQYQMKREMLELQHNRKLNKEQHSLGGKSKHKSKQGKDSTESTGSSAKPASSQESTWKPGSPLKSLSQAIAEQNQWFADAGKDFGNAPAKTNKMGDAAEQTSNKLKGLARSADAEPIRRNAEAASISANAFSQAKDAVIVFATACISAAKQIQNMSQQAGNGEAAGGLTSGSSDSGDVASGSGGDSFNSVLPSVGEVSTFPSASAAGVTDMLASSGSQLAQISSSSNFRNSTVNNYYVDSARLAESVDARAMAKMISKISGQEERRIRTYTGR